MKILVVEDEIYSRKSLVKQIRDLDPGRRFEIFEAANGRQGLELFRREKAELILSDIKMPYLSGLELLKQINRENPFARVVMVSGYAEFDYAREALNHGATGYLLKPVDDGSLQKVLGEFQRHGEAQQEKLLLGGGDSLARYMARRILAERPEADYVMDSVFQRIFPDFRFLLLYFPQGDTPDRARFYRALKAMYPAGSGAGFRLLDLSGAEWGLVCRDSGGAGAPAGRLEEFFDREGCVCRTGVSASHSGAGALREAFREARAAVKSLLLSPGRTIFFEALGEAGPEARKARKDTGLLRVCLEQGDAAGALAQAEKALEVFWRDGAGSVAALEGYLRKLAGLCHDALMRNGVSGTDLERAVPEFDLLRCGDRDSLTGAVRDGIGAVCEAIAAHSVSNRADIVTAVLEYVESNYDKELSLKHLAENVFFVNHSYLSHLISEQTGTSYTAYLQQIRLEKAKEFLANPGLSITQVAALSGYNDTSRFIQVFRRSVGVTPKKYRDSLRGEA